MEGFDADALTEAFDIGDGYEPVLLVTVGYPAEDADESEAERKYRRPLDDVVHYETFDPLAETDISAGKSRASPTPADD